MECTFWYGLEFLDVQVGVDGLRGVFAVCWLRDFTRARLDADSGE